MGNGDNKAESIRSAEIDHLRESIRHSFPNEPFSGKITVSDEYLDDPEFDEEKELHDCLNGRRWTEISNNLFDSQPSTFELLTEEAFPAFLAAWLMYALNTDDNPVRDSLVFSFSNTMRKFRVLNPIQQSVVRSLMEQFASSSSSSFVREKALEAVALIDKKRY